jgi:hypothetical protein
LLKNSKQARNTWNHYSVDMKMMTPTESSAILEDKDFRVSDGQIKEWQKAAQQANEGSVPSHVRTDHRKDDRATTACSK